MMRPISSSSPSEVSTRIGFAKSLARNASIADPSLRSLSVRKRNTTSAAIRLNATVPTTRLATSSNSRCVSNIRCEVTIMMAPIAMNTTISENARRLYRVANRSVFGRIAELIADAPYRPDVLRRVRIDFDLRAQPGEMGADRVLIVAAAIAPHLVEQLPARVDPPRVLREVKQ